MPTLAQMRTAVDNWLTNKWPAVTSRQETYFANQGRYWQGLITHLVPPAHTNSTDGSKTGDRLDQGPSDQPNSRTWLDVFPEWLSELLPATAIMDVYDGPLGKGYVATVRATHNGTLYERSQNVGPETWRTQAWHQAVAP
jgi:hypothetical protein